MVKFILGLAVLLLLYETAIGGQLITTLIILAVLSVVIMQWDTVNSELTNIINGKPGSVATGKGFG